MEKKQTGKQFLACLLVSTPGSRHLTWQPGLTEPSFIKLEEEKKKCVFENTCCVDNV